MKNCSGNLAQAFDSLSDLKQVSELELVWMILKFFIALKNLIVLINGKKDYRNAYLSLQRNTHIHRGGKNGLHLVFARRLRSKGRYAGILRGSSLRAQSKENAEEI